MPPNRTSHASQLHIASFAGARRVPPMRITHGSLMHQGAFPHALHEGEPPKIDVEDQKSDRRNGRIALLMDLSL